MPTRPSDPYAILMAGQLTEEAGMGRPLLESGSFRREAEALDDLSEGRFLPWITDASQEELAEEAVASRAVLLFDIALGRCIMERLGAPAWGAGYSLGFYAAAVAAGSLDAATALAWVDRVNGRMEEHFGDGSHGIGFVIGLSRKAVEETLEKDSRGLHIANFNNRSSFVLGGPSGPLKETLDALAPRALKTGLLPLRFPLHTPCLTPVAEEEMPWWSTRTVRAPAFPLICPADGSVMRRAEEVDAFIPASIRRPTDWVSVVEALGGLGVRRVVDTSADGSLGRMTRWVDRSLEVLHYREVLTHA